MTDKQLSDLVTQFYRLDDAAARMLLAQPSTMTDAAEKLNAERLAMREVVQSIICTHKEPSNPSPNN